MPAGGVCSASTYCTHAEDRRRSAAARAATSPALARASSALGLRGHGRAVRHAVERGALEDAISSCAAREPLRSQSGAPLREA